MMLGVMWMMTAAVVGFMLGRVSMYGQALAPEEQEGMEEEEQTAAKEGGVFRWRRKGHQEEERTHWSVGSPVSGFAEVLRDGERPVVVIEPDCDGVYAPAGGKITRLFPMGNAFRLVTEFGAELYVQVGDGGDELMGAYYRPRIMQNEIVGKGKLLIEFDRRGLEMVGASCLVKRLRGGLPVWRECERDRGRAGQDWGRDFPGAGRGRTGDSHSGQSVWMKSEKNSRNIWLAWERRNDIIEFKGRQPGEIRTKEELTSWDGRKRE